MFNLPQTHFLTDFGYPKIQFWIPDPSLETHFALKICIIVYYIIFLKLTIFFSFQTGMLIDVNVHPDDDLFQIKQIIISTATSDGKILE